MGIAKVIEIIASSEESFDDAVQMGVSKAAETLHGIHGVHVKEWTADVKENRIVNYKVVMHVAFRVDDTGGGERSAPKKRAKRRS